MVKRFMVLLAGCAVISSAMGCCCGLLGGYKGGYGGCGPCGGYGAGYSSYGGGGGMSPCGPGGCAPSYYPPTGGAAMPGFGSSAYMGDPALSSAAAVPGSTFTTTTMLPMQTLPY
jgi:hypothetical protein